MNCAEIVRMAGLICSPAGENSYRVIAPFTLGKDGRVASFFVAKPSQSTYFITDAGETVMHAESLGIRLNKSRINIINNTYSVSLAKIDEYGCITSSGDIDDLSDAIWDAIKLMMALFFRKESWQPKFAQEKFRSIVFKELSAQLGAENVIRKARVKASSGNVVEFPIGIKQGQKNMIYVSPLALENGWFNWSNVYQLHGKFSDVQSASEINNRIAILEHSDNEKESRKVANFLMGTAVVKEFSSETNWQTVFSF